MVLSQLFPFATLIRHLCNTCMIVATKQNKNEHRSPDNLVLLKFPPNLSSLFNQFIVHLKHMIIRNTKML